MNKFSFKIIFILFLALLPVLVNAQKKRNKYSGVTNLRQFDKQKMHFGFSLGYNSSSYASENNRSVDTLTVLEVQKMPGFNVHLLSVYHFSKNVKLKFDPGIAFQARNVEYTRYSPVLEESFFEAKPIESTVLELPLTFKLRTNRIGNFAAAVLLGGKFNYDFDSQSTVVDDTVLKVYPQDYAATAGVGIDFFLQYFKLGLELQYAHGFNDLLVHDTAPSATPISYLQSRVWTFKICFEGSW